MRRDLGSFLVVLGGTLLFLSAGFHLPLWEATWLMLVGGVLEFLKKD